MMCFMFFMSFLDFGVVIGVFLEVLVIVGVLVLVLVFGVVVIVWVKIMNLFFFLVFRGRVVYEKN